MVYIWDREVRKKGHFQKVEIRTKIPKTFHQTKINGTTTHRINFVHTCIYLNTRTFGHQNFLRNIRVKKWCNQLNFERSSSRVLNWNESYFHHNHHWHCWCLHPFTLSQLRSMMMNWLRLVLYKFYLLFWL